MKKLFAMLLALCMVCGVGCAGAEEVGSGRVTVGDFSFVIPEGWTGTRVIKQDQDVEESITALIESGATFSDEQMAMLNAHLGDAPKDSFHLMNGSLADGSFTAIMIRFDNAATSYQKDLMNKYYDLDMVSPAEEDYYSLKTLFLNPGAIVLGPKDDFVTIGWFAGEPIRRPYTGFTVSSEAYWTRFGYDITALKAEGYTADEVRATAVVWSSEELGVEIVITQQDHGNVTSVDSIVDEIMLSFSYDGEKGSYEAGRDNDSSVTLDSPSSFDMGDLDLSGFDMSGSDMDSFDMSGFDAGSFDMSGFDMSGFDMSSFDMDSFDMDSFGSFLGQ